MIRHNVSRRKFMRASAGLAAASVAVEGRPQSPSQSGPQWPSLHLNVRAFGAVGDGKTKDTRAIQRAIDRCSVLGGGEVVVPAGEYLTGALALRSNTLLRLEDGATISGSPEFEDYPVTQVRWEGKWILGRVGLIYALDASHIGIAGAGKIAGNPAVGGRPTRESPLRHPALIEPIGCRDILLDGFSTTQGLMWSVHPTNCQDVVIRNLTIRSVTGNGDGIDIDSTKRVRIQGCDIATGDDCISIKSGRGSEAYALLQTSEDIAISDCTMADSIFACIGIGSETSGGIRNVRIERCKFTGARTFALYIKTRVGRGAFIEDISANDLDVSGTVGGFLRFNLLDSGLQDEAPVPGDEGIPTTRNFRFSNVRLHDCPLLVEGTRIHPAKPLDGFSLIGVSGECAKGIALANVKNAEIRDINVTGLTGPLVSAHNVSGMGIEGAAPIDGPKLPEPIPAPSQPYRLH